MKTTNLYVLALSADLSSDEFSKHESYLAGRESVKQHKTYEIKTLARFCMQHVEVRRL